MISSGFDTSDLSGLEKQLLKLANEQYPKEAKSFLRTQGNKAKTRLRNRTKSVTKKKTGNLLRGIDKSAPKLYEGSFQIRVYNKAPHAHLIEHGHSNIKTRPGKGKIPIGHPVQMVSGHGKALFVDGKEIWVPGRHPAAKTTNELKEIFPGEVDKFLDELLEKGLG